MRHNKYLKKKKKNQSKAGKVRFILQYVNVYLPAWTDLLI